MSPNESTQVEKAINLIVYDANKGKKFGLINVFWVIGFYVSEEAITLLRGTKEKIGIIAVAGKYRTGKSFLLNRIILNKTDHSGFGVGPTINPCTKVYFIFKIYLIYRDCGSGTSLLKLKTNLENHLSKSLSLTAKA